MLVVRPPSGAETCCLSPTNHVPYSSHLRGSFIAFSHSGLKNCRALFTVHRYKAESQSIIHRKCLNSEVLAI